MAAFAVTAAARRSGCSNDARPNLGEGPVRTKSPRSALDAQARLGEGTTRLEERVLASVGALRAAAIRPERVEDVPNAEVLRALPALLALGLLRHSRTHFTLRPGFYPLESIFLTMSFLALARVSSLEA